MEASTGSVATGCKERRLPAPVDEPARGFLQRGSADNGPLRYTVRNSKTPECSETVITNRDGRNPDARKEGSHDRKSANAKSRAGLGKGRARQGAPKNGRCDAGSRAVSADRTYDAVVLVFSAYVLGGSSA